MDMKLKNIILLISSVLISACSNADMTLTQRTLKPVIEYQCAKELKASKFWTASTYFMQDKNKAELEQNVCSCVGENALKDIPASTLLKATLDEEVKSKLTQQAIANSLKGCMTEFLK